MARRTLNAPRYDTPVNRDEFLSRGAYKPAPKPPRPEHRAAVREQKRNAPATQRKRFDKERERAVRQVRQESVMGDPLAQLQRRSQMCQEQYVASLRASGILGVDHTKESQKEEMSELHKAYTAMMVLQAVHPLQRGLNVQNISTAASMGVTMAMMSPNFREITKDYLGQIKGMGQQIKDAVRQRQGDAAQKNLDALADKHGSADPKQLRGRNAAHAAKWAKRVERMEHMQRGYREPFTENSAALTQVGLAEAAYFAMRRPGADVEAVMGQYASATSALYAHMEEDMIDRAGVPEERRGEAVAAMHHEVSQHMRIIVGQRMDKDPATAAIFSELAHGKLTKTAPQKVFVAGTTQMVTAWNGDFYNVHEDGLVTGGVFEVRRPMDDLRHREAMARTLYCHLEGAETPAELDEKLRGFMVGTAVNEDPRTVDLVEDPQARRSMEISRTMFGAMEADGFDEKARLMVYGTSVLDAMSAFEQLHPERAQSWKDEFGPNWNDVVKTKMAEYGDLGEQAAQRPTREQTAARMKEEFDMRTGPFTPEARRVELQIDEGTGHGVEEDDEVLIPGELATEEGAENLPRHLSDVEHQKVDVSPAADFEAQYTAYFQTHLSHAVAKGGVGRFAAVAESLRLMNVAPDDSVTGEAVVESFSLMDQAGLGEPVQRAIYADGLTKAMQNVAEESPEVKAHMKTLYGTVWPSLQVRRIEDPAAYTPPALSGEESQAAQTRMFTEAMSEAISGDLAAAAAGARAGDEGAAVHMVMREYLSETSPIDAGVEDQQWHLRRARIEQMKSSMQKSGMSEQAQTHAFATAFTHAVEQSTRRSSAVKFAAEDLFSKKRNWQDNAYQAAVGGEGVQIKSKEYRRRKDLMGLPGSSSAHAQAEAQLKQDLGPSSKGKAQYELNRHKTSRKAQRQRENLHYNGYDVNSGRFDEATPEPAGPELG